MIIKNDFAPIVVLVVLLLTGACLFGVVSDGSKIFNPTQMRLEAQATATQNGIEAQGKQAAVQATLTAQSAVQNRDAIVAQMTEVPLRQTQEAQFRQATQAAGMFQATVDAQAYAQRQKEADFQETQAVRQHKQDQQAFQDQTNALNRFGTLAAAVLAAGLMIFITLQAGLWIRADAQRRVHEAEAKAAVEKRRLAEIQAAITRAEKVVSGNGHRKDTVLTKEMDGKTANGAGKPGIANKP